MSGSSVPDGIWSSLSSNMTSPVAQTVKRLPTTRETWVWSLGWEDLPEKEMATHSSIRSWKIPWLEEPGRLQSMGVQRVGHNWATFTLFTPQEKAVSSNLPSCTAGMGQCLLSDHLLCDSQKCLCLVLSPWTTSSHFIMRYSLCTIRN